MAWHSLLLPVIVLSPPQSMKIDICRTGSRLRWGGRAGPRQTGQIGAILNSADTFLLTEPFLISLSSVLSITSNSKYLISQYLISQYLIKSQVSFKLKVPWDAKYLITSSSGPSASQRRIPSGRSSPPQSSVI